MKLALGNSLAMPRIGGAAAWSPLALSPLIWLDATQLGLANNDPVAEFTDLSGNGNHFVQGTTPNKPTFKASGINGLASVEGDGVDDTMTLAGVGSQAAWSAFIVLKQTAVSTAEECYWCIADITTALYKVIQKAAGVDGGAGISVAFNPAVGFSFASYTAGTTRAMLVTASASATRGLDNTGDGGSSASNNSRGDEQMRIFSRNDGLNAPLQIGELVYTDHVLTSEEETALWAYSAAKWGHDDPS